jgi:hypothetical protein
VTRNRNKILKRPKGASLSWNQHLIGSIVEDKQELSIYILLSGMALPAGAASLLAVSSPPTRHAADRRQHSQPAGPAAQGLIEKCLLVLLALKSAQDF